MTLLAYNRVQLIATCLALGVVFALEIMGLVSTRFVTITAICRDVVPRWVRAMICGWLCYHFVVEK